MIKLLIHQALKEKSLKLLIYKLKEIVWAALEKHKAYLYASFCGDSRSLESQNLSHISHKETFGLKLNLIHILLFVVIFLYFHSNVLKSNVENS